MTLPPSTRHRPMPPQAARRARRSAWRGEHPKLVVSADDGGVDHNAEKRLVRAVLWHRRQVWT